ncbi:MAG: response regulator [Treponema sp.]|nr:response regulator [Treponema sp.]
MSSNKKRILIIDDEKINILALAHFLKPQYEIIVAVDGVSALETVEKHLPDLILLDIIMPDMSGFDVIAKLKGSAATKDIPVIFITGLSNASDEATGLSLGAVDYIAKPFNKPLVNARIASQLEKLEYIRIIENLCRLLGISVPVFDIHNLSGRSADDFITEVNELLNAAE